MQMPKCLNPSRNDSNYSLPLDVRDLTVRLETEGVCDAVARDDYGFADTWELAEAHFPALLEKAEMEHRSQPVGTPQTRKPIVDYANGILFALPLFISCLAILLLRYSLWGSPLPAETASALGLAVVSSFIVSGGFVQVMTRHGLWYLGTKQFNSCVRATWTWFARAIFVILLWGVCGIAISVHLEVLPVQLCPVAAAFYFSLSLLWLSAGMLYMLQRSLIVAGAILFGLLLVVLLHRAFGVELLIAQVASILAAALSAMAVAVYLLRKRAAGDPSLPHREPLGRTIYYLAPYFFYGCLYYLFLFADRLLAWTARTDLSGLSIQFRGAYEAAQDMALFAFIIQVGWVHLATVRFYDHLKQSQEELAIYQSDLFNRRLTAYYWQIGQQFVPISIAASVTVFLCAYASGNLVDMLHVKVILWSLAGYLFLVPGLRNVSLLFALSRPGHVLTAIICACITNVSCGYLLSRFLNYEDAIAGFTFGAIVFAAVSTVYTLRVLQRLDYHYLTSGG